MTLLAIIMLLPIILSSASIGWTLGRSYQKLYGDQRFRWWRWS